MKEINEDNLYLTARHLGVSMTTTKEEEDLESSSQPLTFVKRNLYSVVVTFRFAEVSIFSPNMLLTVKT